MPTLESRAISNGLAAPVATSEAPDVAGARMERAATDRAAVAGENLSGARVWVGGADGLCGRLVPSLFGRGRRDAPPRSGETGGKGCRLSGRRGRHARRRPGMESRRRRKGHRPRPSARKRERQTAGVNAGHTSGTHAGPTLLDACKRANRQVGGRNGTGQVDNGTPDHTDTVKAWTRLQRVMPSASLVNI
jgi:hypothetical protein